MKKPEKRELGHLRKAMDQKNAKWLEERHSDVADAVRLEIEGGATSGDVENFAQELAGEQDWFARKVASAARHIERTNAQRR